MLSRGGGRGTEAASAMLAGCSSRFAFLNSDRAPRWLACVLPGGVVRLPLLPGSDTASASQHGGTDDQRPGCCESTAHKITTE